MARYLVEYTDTFGGEANYSWVKRAEFDLDFSPDVARNTREFRIRKRARELMGLTGLRGEWTEYGDSWEFRPRGICSVLFVRVDY